VLGGEQHGERLIQLTDTTAAQSGNGGQERLLYIHEDPLGTTKKFTKGQGTEFSYLKYDAWGLPAQPNQLLNNDHGNFIAANFTGHTFDTTLDMYHAEARFYDAGNRTFISRDPDKDGLNWYKYVGNNPATYTDPDGLERIDSDYLYVNTEYYQTKNGVVVVISSIKMTQVEFTNLNATVYTMDGINFNNSSADLAAGNTQVINDYTSLLLKGPESYNSLSYVEKMDTNQGLRTKRDIVFATISGVTEIPSVVGFLVSAIAVTIKYLIQIVNGEIPHGWGPKDKWALSGLIPIWGTMAGAFDVIADYAYKPSFSPYFRLYGCEEGLKNK